MLNITSKLFVILSIISFFSTLSAQAFSGAKSKSLLIEREIDSKERVESKFISTKSNSGLFPVPFKYPKVSYHEFATNLAKNSDHVAVVLGGGPSGLIAALELRKDGRMEDIVIIEKRDKYIRDNMISFKDFSLSVFEKFEVLDEVLKSATHSKVSRFHWQIGEGPRGFVSDAFNGRPSEINFSEKVQTLFDQYQAPHFGINISDLEAILAAHAAQTSRVFILKGEGEPIFPKDKSGRISVQYHSGTSEFDSFLISQPALVVVAEGNKSKFRTLLGIESNEMKRPREVWCSGTVVLNGILPEKGLEGQISTASVVENKNQMTVFGAIRPQTYDLFVGGTVSSSENEKESTEDCVKRNAHLFLNYESEHLSQVYSERDINIPKSYLDFLVLPGKTSRYNVHFNRSNQFHYGVNVVLMGDSAGTGSPSAGVGLNLAITFYREALSALVKALFEEKVPPEQGMREYDKRVEEILDYWQR